MKHYKAVFIVVAMTVLSLSVSTHAKNKVDHDKDMEAVLFGGKASEEQKKAAECLEAAAYLTIDQFGGNGQDQWQILNDMKKYAGSLPEIAEIDIAKTEINHHREYTHQGWDSKYRSIRSNKTEELDTDWQEKWKLRKRILEDTVEGIFDFSWWGGIPFIGSILPDYGEQCDSICAVIYYTHLLGDHEETKKIKQYGYLLPVGGKFNQKDIIHELIYHSSVLFISPQNKKTLSQFKSKLELVNTKYYRLGSITSEEQLSKNQEYAEEVLSLMGEYIHKMLKNESFFEKVKSFGKAA